MAARSYKPSDGGPAHLVVLPKPCSYRTAMIESLERINRDWIAACTASSLMGVQAAVAGGFGVTALGRSFLTSEMQELTGDVHWPELPAAEIVILSEDERCAGIVDILTAFLTDSLTATVAESAAATPGRAAAHPMSITTFPRDLPEPNSV